MNKRTTAILVTVATTLFCACPGLFSLLMGGMFALASFTPGAEIDVFGSKDPQAAMTFGLGGLCAGGLFLVIAAVVIFLTWRRQPASQA